MEAIRVDGLHVEVVGVRDGPTLVFSAGLGGGGGYWSPHLPALADMYRIVTYDHRGTGRSERPVLRRPYAVRDMAEDVRQILDFLEIDQAHIVGHAAGGCVGLELALAAPDRIASLIVINGWDRADRHFARCMAIRREILRASGVEAYLRAQPLFLYPASWIEANLAALDAALPHHLANFQDEATLSARMDALVQFDVAADLHRITAPALLISARDDMLVTAEASERLAAGLPNARAVVFERGGHAINITEQAAFETSLLTFLRDSQDI